MWWILDHFAIRGGRLCGGSSVAPLQEEEEEVIVPDENNPYGYRVHNANKHFICREPYDLDGRPENYIYISRRIRKKN